MGKSDKKQYTASEVALGVIVAVLGILLVTWILQLSWNASLPKAFSGAKSISFSVAFFMIIVSMILFPRVVYTAQQ